MTHDADAPPASLDPDDEDPVGATLGALEDALDALRERHPEDTPQWEYCEGVLTALLCTRRAVPPDEWLPMLFGPGGGAIFASEGERTHFMKIGRASCRERVYVLV